MKILAEINEEVSVQILSEGAGQAATKSYFLEGTFLQGDLVNKNKRFYPMRILTEKVNVYREDFINKKRAFGELGHPDGPRINLDRVSHMTVKLDQEGNNFIGKAKIIGTPYGKIVQNFMEADCRLGVSSRALGSTHARHGCNYVNDDLVIATAADIVADPSAPDAFVQAVMESAEWVYVEGKGWICDFVDQSRERISKTTSRKLEEAKIAEFKKYMEILQEDR